MSYAEKLKDPRWQKKRLEIFERDGWRCKICGSEDDTLNVHHLTYRKGFDPWEINNGLLMTVCSKCHERSKEDDEDMCGIDSFMNDMGTLLDTFWKSGFEQQDLLLLAEAVFKVRAPKEPVDSFNLEVIPFYFKKAAGER